MGVPPMSLNWHAMTMSFFEFRQKMTRKVAVTPDTGKAPVGKPLTVSELTAQIDKAIRGGLPPVLLVKGECSNCHPHRESGHLYFTLKDARACIDCVMFRDDAAQLKFEPTAGIELLATGRVGVY